MSTPEKENLSPDAMSDYSESTMLRELAVNMRKAFERGENAMEYARSMLGRRQNPALATLIAYDLQAGSYIRDALANPEGKNRWCAQTADLIKPWLPAGGSVLEAGCGEATTLAGVIEHLGGKASHALGFDISWSRCAHGLRWLNTKGKAATLFVADLFEIPLADGSVDIVYTSHSIEPNGGREEAALRELMRVARRAVVLVEPIFELASAEAQARMMHHGYVRGLREVAEGLGYRVRDFRLLDFCVNPLNPSGVLLLEKEGATDAQAGGPRWMCPLTESELMESAEGYFSATTGFVYPVLGGIPLLRKSHAVIASAFESMLGVPR